MYPVKTGRVNQIDNDINVFQDNKIAMSRQAVNRNDRPGYDFSIETDAVHYDMGGTDFSSGFSGF